jgi:hypothetical protein
VIEAAFSERRQSCRRYRFRREGITGVFCESDQIARKCEVGDMSGAIDRMIANAHDSACNAINLIGAVSFAEDRFVSSELM